MPVWGGRCVGVQVPMDARGIGSPGSEIVASYEPPIMDARDPIQVLQQQWTLLSADPSLQPSLKYVLSYCAITRKNASMAILV